MVIAKQPADQAATPRTIKTRQLYLTLAIVALATWVAMPFLTPIAWAVVLAVAQWPLYRRVVTRFPDHPGWIAAAFTLATALLVIGPVSLAAVTLARESQYALDWLRHAQQSGLPAPAWLAGLPLIGARAHGWWQHYLATPQGADLLLGSVSATSVFGWTRSIGAAVATQSAMFFITLLGLISLLMRGQGLADRGRAAARRAFGEFGEQFLVRTADALRATVNGTVLVSVLEGTLIGVGYAVAGVPQPLLFATFTIILAFIPFGAWLAFGLASLILVGSGAMLAGVLLFAFGVVVMTFGDNVVQPAVIGNAVELPFMFALIGVFGGIAQLGLVGLFVGPVAMAALLLVSRHWLGEGLDDQPQRRGRGKRRPATQS